MQREIQVAFTRGGHVESVHRVRAVVVGPDGELVEELPAGAGASPEFLRSGAKPFQALGAVRAGVLDALGLDDRHLAVACASHVGRAEHVDRVREVLAAAGVPASALRTGIDAPGDPGVARRLAERGESPDVLHHNCSGNHALGLARCALAGWDLAGYLEPDHPLQVEMRTDLAAAAGGLPDEGVDGCGMRAYRLALRAAARAFGRLAGGALGREGDRVAAAMRAHPALVRGEDGPDETLMRLVPGAVAKVGAEGFLGLGLRDGTGLALKVADGAWRALAPAAMALAAHRGIVDPADPAVDSLLAPPVTNVRGTVVGATVCRVTSVTGHA